VIVVFLLVFVPALGVLIVLLDDLFPSSRHRRPSSPP
jgi:hypothetical protein